jgi:imidazolonepropionase-like amidohydrolase
MKSGSLSVYAGYLIVGDGRVQEQVYLGIENGVIKEYSGKYVMPGLIDAHVHLRYDPHGDPEKRSHEYQAIRGVENAQKSLEVGVTSLGEAGGIGNVVFAVRNAINNGVVKGPRLYVSGEMITITGGRTKIPGERMEVNGADSARKAARELLMYHNADFIKLGATGAISSAHTGPRHPQLSVEEMRATAEEAHNCGKLVHGHCYGEKGISNSLEAGVDVIVHGQTLSEGHIKFMKENDLILMPTLKAFCGHLENIDKGGVHTRMVTTGIWPETEPNFRRAQEAGLTISMGTDAGMPDDHFTNNYLDLKYMVNWGMTPSQAITAGTLNALILGRNPTEDISNIWTNREQVYLNGVLL